MTGIITAVIILAGAGILCGVLLSVASVCFAVEKDEVAEAVRDVLPGANCGACGFSGCDGYAAALSGKPGTATNLCVPGGDSVSRQISDIMGVPYQDVVEMVAFVQCMGDCNAAKSKYEYSGAQSCAAANMMYGGKWACTLGCLGYGDCANVCPNGAICIENGIAHVDTRKCTGCGMCTKVCPNHLIRLFPDVSRVVVTCSNTEKGAVTRKECTNGCLGCKKCERECPAGAVTVVDNLARIDYDKCINCGNCAKVCPVGCIKISDMSGIHRYVAEEA